MVCLLCLDNSKEFISVFSDSGIQCNIEAIIKKHFWIVPKENDPSCQKICISCWLKVNTFHTFYLSVVEIHKTLWNSANILQNEEQKYAANDNIIKVESEICNLPTVDLSIGDIDGPNDENLGFELEGELELPIVSLEQSKNTKSADVKDIPKLESSNTYNTRRTSLRKRLHVTKETDATEIDPINTESKCTKSLMKQSSKMKNLVKDKSPRRERQKKAATTMKNEKSLPLSNDKKTVSEEYDKLIAKHLNLSCNVCNEFVPNFCSLQNHYRTLHNERGYALCCNKKFLKRGVLVDHIYLHLNPEYFKCKDCDKVLADRRCLEMHMVTHQSNELKEFQCDKCPKKYHKQSVLTRHKTTHIPEDEWHNKCEECGKLFPSDYALKAHVNNVHERVYAKICDICGKSIRAGKTALKQHLLEHEGVQLPNFQCEQCGSKLRNKYSLKRHMSAMHSEHNITAICKMCGKVSPNPTALKRHYYYVHQCTRKYKCTVCEKAFKKPNSLKEHMTIHTGEVLYTCPHCPKTFNSSANMHSHRKKLHRTEWELNRKIHRPLLVPHSKTPESVAVPKLTTAL